MPHGIATDMAGICFGITCDDAAIGEVFNPAYISFRQAESRMRIADIRIALELDTIPETMKFDKIFSSGDTWSLFTDDDTYLIEFKLLSLPENPLWVACFKRDVVNVTVYCGDTLITRDKGITTVRNPFSYPLDQILMMYVLAQRQGAIIHAAGLEIDTRAYIFPGRSGAGKSTLSRQFAARKHPGMLSDDRIIVRKIDTTFVAFGTPWPGDAGIAENRGAPLAGIFFISQGDDNRIQEISPREAVSRLMPVTSIPWFDSEALSNVLSFCDNLLSVIPSHILHCRPETRVVDVFEEFISR